MKASAGSDTLASALDSTVEPWNAEQALPELDLRIAALNIEQVSSKPQIDTNNDAPPVSQERSRLLTLPAEIRTHIYGHAGIWDFDCNSAGYLGNRRPPGILLTCRSVYQEISERFWAGRTLYINDADYWGTEPCQCCGNYMMGVLSIERALGSRLNAMGCAAQYLTKVNVRAALVCFYRLMLIFEVLADSCPALEDVDISFGKKGSNVISGRQVRMGFTCPRTIVTPSVQLKTWIEQTTAALRQVIERGKLKNLEFLASLDDWGQQEDVDALWESMCAAIGKGKTLRGNKKRLVYNEKRENTSVVVPINVVPLSEKRVSSDKWYVVEFCGDFDFTPMNGFNTFCSFRITQQV
ncbi:uncharacterized protein PpBr36_06220 [Pyricularia pennisetigena]|uniref:uncharacterized protein n=1 Tax=Pyricularia pennisetigena TaxID=1578925 RepID=UPI0011531F2B|nr:uncharacterized protein PpBr36_06220 [Pyricularia pennisetigena]TLS22798.1 hypothetical protein PpBr36_06220 [Pyricularia pennisetigena]